MTSITRDLRKDLEKTVKQARRVAEAGARQAVQQLRVGDGDAPKHLTADQRALRTRLRAHGRQLGDRRDAKTGAQETAHLVQECAYEHWHRMLFARFLAETDLLIEPESGVAITLDEVQELAREKATDWLELASEYAERMLPQIFRKDDPVLQIALPPETRSEMEDLLKGLSKPVFEADDSLGWVYQFWQADKKDEVNKSEIKIGADELPAVTQLFTEDYMVLFLLHNTLGAWWAGKVLAGNPSLAASAARRGCAARCLQGRRHRLDLSALCPRQGEDGDGGPLASGRRRVRGLAESGEGSHCARSLHGVGALPRLRAADPRRLPHGGGRPVAVGGRRCGAAGQSLRAGDRSALHADRGLQSRLRGVAQGWLSSAAAAQSRLLGPRHRRHQGGVAEAG